MVGWYGVAYKKNAGASFEPPFENLPIDIYYVVELAVFMMEDGAAILYLVNEPSNKRTILTKINLWLTVIGGVVMCLFNFLRWSRTAIGFLGLSNCDEGPAVVISGVGLTMIPPISMIVLLLKEVVFKGDDDNEMFNMIPWNIVYYIGLCLWVQYSVFGIQILQLYDKTIYEEEYLKATTETNEALIETRPRAASELKAELILLQWKCLFYAMMKKKIGQIDGPAVGELEGLEEGDELGDSQGLLVDPQLPEGPTLGLVDGPGDGPAVEDLEGLEEGDELGDSEGLPKGPTLG